MSQPEAAHEEYVWLATLNDEGYRRMVRDFLARIEDGRDGEPGLYDQFGSIDPTNAVEIARLQERLRLYHEVVTYAAQRLRETKEEYANLGRTD